VALGLFLRDGELQIGQGSTSRGKSIAECGRVFLANAAFIVEIAGRGRPTCDAGSNDETAGLRDGNHRHRHSEDALNSPIASRPLRAANAATARCLLHGRLLSPATPSAGMG